MGEYEPQKSAERVDHLRRWHQMASDELHELGGHDGCANRRGGRDAGRAERHVEWVVTGRSGARRAHTANSGSPGDEGFSKLASGGPNPGVSAK